MKRLILASIVASTAASSALADSNYYQPSYEVSITNITKGISFTPVLAATHSKRVKLFEVGEEPSAALAAMAEGGDIAPLQEILDSSHGVSDTASTSGLLGPGETVTFAIDATWYSKQLSFTAMLLPTNDSFVALNSVSLPRFRSATYMAKAYDAGSEENDEYCANIPGPTCGGVGGSPETLGEGYVYMSPGIHGEGDLSSAAYDWRGDVAKVVIKRVK